jgi:hypothetical protein
MDLEELPPAVRPAEGEGDGARIIRDGVLFAGQPLEATSFHTNLVDLIEGCSRDNKVPQTL